MCACLCFFVLCVFHSFINLLPILFIDIYTINSYPNLLYIYTHTYVAHIHTKKRSYP